LRGRCGRSGLCTCQRREEEHHAQDNGYASCHGRTPFEGDQPRGLIHAAGRLTARSCRRRSSVVWVAPEELAAGHVRLDSPDHPVGPQSALLQPSTHGPFPFRERRGRPCWQSPAASPETSTRIRGALYVLCSPLCPPSTEQLQASRPDARKTSVNAQLPLSPSKSVPQLGGSNVCKTLLRIAVYRLRGPMFCSGPLQ
jgi:hypothetical protein